MASVVLGLACSRSPLTAVPPEYWAKLGERDADPSRRMFDANGRRVTYSELLAGVDPAVRDELTLDVFQRKYWAIQQALDTLAEKLDEVNPDFVVVMGDDEEEYIHEDNRPAILIYRGETLKNKPRPVAPGADPAARASALMWGDHEADYPVASNLAGYLLRYLIDAEFDISDSLRLEAMAHGFGFMYMRLITKRIVPIVPIILNVHTPPNQPTPKRCYDFGRAVRSALEAWDNPARIAIVATGGLSISVIQPELDQRMLEAARTHDTGALFALPRARMQGSTGEVLCWIAAAGALEHLQMEVLDYVQGYRSPAGTGSGLGFAMWS
jgi:Catalytic LigB subunit of aromatic ring-opening dioxygenase